LLQVIKVNFTTFFKSICQAEPLLDPVENDLIAGKNKFIILLSIFFL